MTIYNWDTFHSEFGGILEESACFTDKDDESGDNNCDQDTTWGRRRRMKKKQKAREHKSYLYKISKYEKGTNYEKN